MGEDSSTSPSTARRRQGKRSIIVFNYKRGLVSSLLNLSAPRLAALLGGATLASRRGILAAWPHLLNVWADDRIVVVVPVLGRQLREIGNKLVVVERGIVIGVARDRLHLQQREVRAEIDRHVGL